MRKLRHVSDIHLEINHMYNVPEFIVGCSGEDLIVNGDLTLTYVLDMVRTEAREVRLQQSLKKFLLQVKGFDRIFFVMGNHEHYHGDFKRSRQLLEDFIYNECGLSPDQFIVLDNDAYELDAHTVLLGATLWTDMRGNHEDAHYFVGRGMNDFHVVRNGDHRFTTYDAYAEHKHTLAWMAEQLERYKDKRVIVTTHHAPSYQSKGRYHDGSTINDGYCSNLEQFILDHPQITNWIHGHTHVNVDYKIGGCHVTTNMRGYVDHDWYCKFDATTFQERVVEY